MIAKSFNISSVLVKINNHLKYMFIYRMPINSNIQKIINESIKILIIMIGHNEHHIVKLVYVSSAYVYLLARVVYICRLES